MDKKVYGILAREIFDNTLIKHRETAQYIKKNIRAHEREKCTVEQVFQSVVFGLMVAF